MGAPQIVGVLAIVIVGIVLTSTTIGEAALRTEGIHVDESSQLFDSAVDLERITSPVCPEVENGENNFCDLSLTTESILPGEQKIAESDDSIIEQLLDNNPFSDLRKIGIETVAVKSDISGKTHSSNSIVKIPLLGNVATVNDDFLVEKVQISFFAKTTDELVTLSLKGTAQFLLDEEVVAKKRIWVSFSGEGSNTIPLKIVDNIPPPVNERPENFDFKFTDEGFQDGDKPIFTVRLKNISGTFTTSEGTKTFEFKDEFIAYQLKLIVDEESITITNEDGKTESIFKDDNELISCSQSKWVHKKFITSNRNTSIFERMIPASTTSDIQVLTTDGELVAEIESFTNTNSDTPNQFDFHSSTPNIECRKIDGLQRNTDYIIKIDGEEFLKTTPREQHNISAEWSTSGDIVIRANCDPLNCAKTWDGGFFPDTSSPLILKATSNFGYSIP